MLGQSFFEFADDLLLDLLGVLQFLDEFHFEGFQLHDLGLQSLFALNFFLDAVGVVFFEILEFLEFELPQFVGAPAFFVLNRPGLLAVAVGVGLVDLLFALVRVALLLLALVVGSLLGLEQRVFVLGLFGLSLLLEFLDVPLGFADFGFPLTGQASLGGLSSLGFFLGFGEFGVSVLGLFNAFPDLFFL